jgi:protein-tyrosine phosphatase
MSELFQVDDHGRLFISPAIEDWAAILDRGIDAVIDLEGGVDAGVPTSHNKQLYVYFPIFDDDLPDPVRLQAVVTLGANLVRSGHRVLSHCGMGFNRSALVAGLILHELGMAGSEVVERIRERRPGALFNERFAEYLLGLPERR